MYVMTTLTLDKELGLEKMKEAIELIRIKIVEHG